MKIKNNIFKYRYNGWHNIRLFSVIQNYVPLKYLETKQEKKLGTSITTIASAITLKKQRGLQSMITSPL